MTNLRKALARGLLVAAFVVAGCGQPATPQRTSVNADVPKAEQVVESSTTTLVPETSTTVTTLRVTTTTAQTLSNGNTYTNSNGNTVHSPAYTSDGNPPSGATAQCRDGTYSFSQHRSGTCSSHGGVDHWL